MTIGEATKLTIKDGTSDPEAQAGDRIVALEDADGNEGRILYRAMDATRPNRMFVRWRWSRRSGSTHLTTDGTESAVVTHVADLLFGRRRWEIEQDKRKAAKHRR